MAVVRSSTASLYCPASKRSRPRSRSVVGVLATSLATGTLLLVPALPPVDDLAVAVGTVVAVVAALGEVTVPRPPVAAGMGKVAHFGLGAPVGWPAPAADFFVSANTNSVQVAL